MEYCTVDEVKVYAPAAAGGKLDDLIQTLIISESEFIDSYLQFDPALATTTERYNGEGGRLLALARIPITVVSSVIVEDTPWSVATKFTDVGYRLAGRFLIAQNQRWPAGMGNVVVTYTAGWTPATVPQEVRQSCIELITFRLNERGHLGQKSKTLSGETVTYDDVSMPKTVADRLVDMRSYVVSQEMS